MYILFRVIISTEKFRLVTVVQIIFLLFSKTSLKNYLLVQPLKVQFNKFKVVSNQ